MKDNLHRLRKVCKYASTVMTAGYIILAIVAVVMIAMCVWAMMDDGIVRTFMDITGAPNDKDMTLVAAGLEAFVVFGVGAVIVFITEKIVKSIESEHSPFTQENADRMMIMCYIFLGTSAIMLILEYLVRETIATAVSMFMGLLFVAVVLYALKLVFQYGAVLQEESDQTL